MQKMLYNTQKTYILHLLVHTKEVTKQDVPHVNGYNPRIMELLNKHDLPIKDRWIKGKNKFGHSCRYKAHFLEKKDKKAANKLLIDLVNRSKN